MPTIWGYGDYGTEPGTMTGWGYPHDGTAVLGIALALSDLMAIADLDSKVVGKSVVDILAMTDGTVKVIPSWLRKLRVEDVEHFITIKRIR